MKARAWITPTTVGNKEHYTVRFEWLNDKWSFDKILGTTENEREAESLLLFLKESLNEEDLSAELLTSVFPESSDFIDHQVNELFKQLKSKGEVVVYDDILSRNMKLFLDHIEYPYQQNPSIPNCFINVNK